MFIQFKHVNNLIFKRPVHYMISYFFLIH